VHPIDHHGQYFDVPGIHLCEPSPQRTPVLYQAGASKRGKDFAAQHAECIFIAAPSRTILKQFVADIRARVKSFCRDPHDVLIFNLHTVITGKTPAEAHAKHADYRRFASDEGALALMSGWTGIDLSKYDLDEPLRHVESNAVQSAVEALSSADPTRVWTVREIARWGGIGGLGPLSVGDPQEIADELQSWVEETDVDGFNLAYALTHETFSDFVELVVPELQRRGVYKTEYASGSLREKLHGGGPRLADPHPGARYRARHTAHAD
jgi:FMN-dependent oxidoreductase (nitrilotriacetate monooxygenase family)